MQNSASNRKWLTIAEKRVLTLRSLPRPTLSTAVLDKCKAFPDVVVNPASRHAAEHAEGVVMSVEQHLMRLLRIGPQNERAAVGELDVGDL